METRNQVKRKQDALAQQSAPQGRSTRATKRQKPAPSTRGRKRGPVPKHPKEPEVASSGDEEEEEDEDEDDPDVEVSSPPQIARSRRYAPVRYRGESSPSFIFNHVKDGEIELEEGDDKQEDEEVGDARSAIPDDDNDAAGVRNVRIQNLPLLRKTTSNFILALRDAGPRTNGFRIDLRAKRGMFQSILQLYQDQEPSSPFLELDKFQNLDTGSHHALRTLANANLASALDLMDTILAAREEDVLPHLTKLEEVYWKLCIPLGTQLEDPELTVELRTLIFLKKFGNGGAKMSDAFPLLASVFCQLDEDNPEVDYPKVLARGPFKPLGSQSGEGMDDLCGNRTKKILDEIKDGSPFLTHTTQYVIQTLLQQWILAVYDVSMEHLQIEPTAGQDESHETEERFGAGESQSSVGTPDFVRLEESQPRASLFKGPESLKALLNSTRPRASPTPPSNQQQRNNIPDDYDHSNAALLGPRPPSVAGSSAGGSQAAAGRAPPPPPQRSQTISRDDEEEEDPFEEDTRPIRKDKEVINIHTIKPVRPQRRSHQPVSYPMAPPPRPPPSSSIPPSSNSTSLSTKSLAYKRHLAQLPRPSQQMSSFRQRQAWSDNDTVTLLDLIVSTQAAWSTMENVHNGRFEYPRNQQAYRDKARNLKVDYLLYDRVLPACFNLVALSVKEVNRLISYGKNPYRREDDLDDHGVPINTEHARPDEE